MVHEFELRVIKSGIELSGGQLKGLLVFPAWKPERALRLVGISLTRTGRSTAYFQCRRKAHQREAVRSRHSNG